MVPSDVTATGTCRTPLSELNLAWPVPKNKEKTNEITFRVAQKENASSVFVIETDIYLDEENFPGARGTYKNHSNDKKCMCFMYAIFMIFLDQNKRISRSSKLNIDLFSAPANGLYNCTNDHRIEMNDIEMSITNVVFVAFNTEEDVREKIGKILFRGLFNFVTNLCK